MKRWLYPTGVERDYLAAIRRTAVRRYERAVQQVLMPALSVIFEQSRQDVDVLDIPQSEGWFETLRVALVETLVLANVPLAEIAAIVSRVGLSAATFNEREFRSVLRSVYSVDIITPAPPGMRAALSQFEAENIALIRSIPQQSLASLQGKIVEAVRTGRTLQATKAMVRDEFGVTDRRAELIARDQIGKLNSDLTRMRQEQIGVDEYTWRGILDSRERPEHVAREGKVYRWDKPPEDGNPGQPIRCRCTGEPVLPSWEEMERRITGGEVPAGIYR